MNEAEGEKFLESNSSFVPAATANPGASRVALAEESNSGGFEGKVVMTYEQLKATGALTPVKPNDSAPFASPTTKRTQRAAAKLAERRKTTSPKELVGSGVIGGGDGEEKMESTPTYTTNVDAPKAMTSSNRNGAVNLDSDFGEEKGSTGTSTTATTRSNKGKSKTAGCFASPPLSGATSAGTRRFVSSQQKSSGGGKKGAACTGRPNSSRRSINGTATSPSIGEDGDSRTPLKTLPLSVQREMERKKDARELAASKSSTNPNFDSRRNLDKRTARLRYSGDFMADLAKHRTSLASPLAKEASCAAAIDAEAATPSSSNNNVEICIRKRPIFQYELARGEFDVVAIGDDTGNGAEITINNCVMHADMRRKLVKPTFFPCTKAFDEHTTQDDIYTKVAQPMVQHAARGAYPPSSCLARLVV